MRFSKRPQPVALAHGAEPDPALAPVPEPSGGAFVDPAELLAEPAPAANPVTAAHAQPPARRAESEPVVASALAGAAWPRAPSGWPIWLAALAVSALWALAPIAYALGYRAQVSPLQDDRFALVVFALLAIGPAVLIWAAAYMVRQGQKLAFETRRAKGMADDMLSPALSAAAQTGSVADAIRQEIVRASAAAGDARETLLALRETLAMETANLTDATSQSVRTARQLAEALGRERAEMGALAQGLDVQATRISDTITQQARMVADAAGLAETQIREAEGALSARAADLAAAAGEASQAARAAGEDLTRHIARLETAGVGVAEQIRAVEGGLTEQRTALVTLSSALRADHETFGAQAEAHAGRLTEFIDETRRSAAAMTDQATRGGEALRRLMAEAAEQFRDLADTARAEREEFGQSTLHALEAVSAAAAEQRAQLEAQTRGAIDALAVAAEETRQAAARHAATARDQVDQLSEAAFTAGQKANQVFEARLDEARSLVEQSSRMVEEAGAATARKLEEGAASARAALDELAGMLAEIDRRAAQMPEAARRQAGQVREAVTHSVEALMEQARRTAAEAQAIDAAFQDRVRRNFEMLSEAVRLMGTVAAAPAPPLTTAPSAPAPAPLPVLPASGPAPIAAAPRTAAALVEPAPAANADEPEELELEDLVEAASPNGGAALADRLGIRQRLRFTPTATDAEFSAVFAAAGGRAPEPGVDTDEDAEEPSDGEAWTWKDLLASLDGEDGEGQRLEGSLAAELAHMGVDAAKLLPAPRLRELAGLVGPSDAPARRGAVEGLAPAATRRIARRLSTDDELKRRTEIYVRRYRILLEDAAVRDPNGGATAELLDSESGRLFLLLDAAGGEAI